jgi:hypothetical protein
MLLTALHTVSFVHGKMHSDWFNGIYFKVDGSMEKNWDTVIPADLKRLFVSVCPAGHERVKHTGPFTAGSYA